MSRHTQPPEDLLGFSNYVKGLCDFATSCTTPMTIALQGDWGSGKTSVMQMMKNKLDKSSTYCVWFNTWQFSQFDASETLSLALIREIVRDLKISCAPVAKDILGSLDIIEKAKSTLPSIITALSKLIPNVGNEVAEFIQALSTTKTAPATEAIAELRGNFEECIKVALEEHKVERILIFVDDLDRLQPFRAIELLEVLKIFLDCENCVFVLALDYDVVISGLDNKYGSEIASRKGKIFFDKIIQVPFRMPVDEYNADDFIEEELARLDLNNQDISEFSKLLEHSVGYNPRSMKRLFSSCSLMLKIKKELQKPYKKKVFFALLCMQQQFEILHDALAKNIKQLELEKLKILLQGVNIFEIDENDFEEAKVFLKHFARVLGGISEDSLVLLQELLPSSDLTRSVGDDSAQKGKRTVTFFEYKNTVYKSTGQSLRPATLALRLIKDYLLKENKSADNLEKMLSTDITDKFWSPRIHPFNDDSDKAKLKTNVFSDQKDLITSSDGKSFAVASSWGSWEVSNLIELLKFENEVTISSNDKNTAHQ